MRHSRVLLRGRRRATTVELVAPDRWQQPRVVLLLHGMWGLNDHVRDVAWKWGQEGVAVAIPSLHDDAMKAALAPERLVALEQECGLDLCSRPPRIPSASAGGPRWQRDTMRALVALHSPRQQEACANEVAQLVPQLAERLERSVSVTTLGMGSSVPAAVAIACRVPAVEQCVGLCGGEPAVAQLAESRVPTLGVFGRLTPVAMARASAATRLPASRVRWHVVEDAAADFLDGRRTNWRAPTHREAWSSVVEFVTQSGSALDGLGVAAVAR